MVADVNGDGIPDLLQPAMSLGGVGVYLGKGNGTFQLASVVPLVAAANIVTGDFNHDGKVDIATSSNQMALGNGDGTFQAPAPILASIPRPGFMGWIAAGDFNNDGWTDLVLATPVDLLLNNQAGGFSVYGFGGFLQTITFAAVSDLISMAMGTWTWLLGMAAP